MNTDESNDKTFLKDVIESRKKTKKKLLVQSSVLFASLITLAAFTLASVEKKQDQNNVSRSGVNTSSPSALSEPKEEMSDNNVQSTEQHQSKTVAPAENTYVPSASQFNRSEFINDGHKLAVNYGEIIELLSFTPNMTAKEKSQRIEQAAHLDSMFFNSVNLRGHLVSSNIKSGIYMDIVETAEDSISSMSVGVGNMLVWAKDNNRTIDYSIGKDGFYAGVEKLQQFNSALNSL